MTLQSSVSPSNPDELLVEIPATRPDILHECDIMEDAAIAFGFNNLPDRFPATNTIAQPLAISKLSDVVRVEWALAGWVEVLPLILVRSYFLNLVSRASDRLVEKCSHEENFEWMNRDDDGSRAVKIANPKTFEFQVVRTSLIPGLLKTVRENRSHPLPIRIFETADVVVKDVMLERQARNIRHAAAVWCNKTAGFEVVHGLLDRVMKMLEVPRIMSSDVQAETGYYIKETSGMFSCGCLVRALHLRRSPPLRSRFFPWPRSNCVLPGASGQTVGIYSCDRRYPSHSGRCRDWYAWGFAPDCLGKVRDRVPMFCAGVQP